MDVSGARQLAARLRANVRIGERIELVSDETGSGLHAGDCGLVQGISDDGNILVAWERGFSLEIDPAATPVRPGRLARPTCHSCLASDTGSLACAGLAGAEVGSRDSGRLVAECAAGERRARCADPDLAPLRREDDVAMTG